MDLKSQMASVSESKVIDNTYTSFTHVDPAKDQWGLLSYVMLLQQFLLAVGIFTGRKHREFCATFVLFCAVYAEFCTMLLVADFDIIPCAHCCILLGLNVPYEFSRS